MYRPRFVLPAVVYAAVGREMNIYFNQLARLVPGTSPVSFAVDCSVGEIRGGAFRWTPATAGLSRGLTVYAVDVNGRQVASAGTVIISVEDDAGAGLQNVMLIGDSLTMRDIYVEEFFDLIAAGGGASALAVGIQGTSPNFHEGRGGATIYDYSGPGDAGYLFTVDHTAISTNPTAGAVYSEAVSGEVFTFAEDRIDRFDLAFFIGTGAPAASGTLTKVSGTGDASITYSAVSAEGRNPFYDDDNSRLDFQKYLTDYSQNEPDSVFIMLGINDVSEGGGLIQSDFDVDIAITRINAILTGVTNATYGFPDADVTIVVEPPGASKEAYDQTHEADDDYHAFQDGMRDLAEAIISNYDAGAYAANVTVCLANLWIDRENGYPTDTQARNDRDATVITVQDDNSHPLKSPGGEQIADGIYSHFRGIQPLGAGMNLITPSEDLTATGDWTHGPGSTITTNNEAPDLELDAFGFAYATADDQISYKAVAKMDSVMAPYGVGRWVQSVYVKPLGTIATLNLIFRNTLGTPGNNSGYFNWSAGVPVPGSTSDAAVDNGAEYIGGGWYRCWVEYEITDTALGWVIRAKITNGATTVGDGHIFWGWQLEKRTGGPGPYLATP